MLSIVNVETPSYVNTIRQIDGLELVKSLPDKSIDCIIIDPPYGVIRPAWDKKVDFKLFFKEFRRVIRLDGAIVVFTMQPFTTEVISAWPEGYRYQWIWAKNRATNPLNAKNRPMRKHEEITIFSQLGAANIKNKMRYFPQGLTKIDKVVKKDAVQSNWELRGHMRDKTRMVQEYTGYPTSVLEFPSEAGLHPTQKPVPLLEYLIKTYTLENEIVLDCFCGSGTTGEACINLNRGYVLGDTAPDYFEIAKQRLIDVDIRVNKINVTNEDVKPPKPNNDILQLGIWYI